MRPRHLVAALVVVAAVAAALVWRRSVAPAQAQAAHVSTDGAPSRRAAADVAALRQLPTALPEAAAPIAGATPLAEEAARAEGERTVAALAAHGRRCWEARTPVATPAGQPDETMQTLALHLKVTVQAGVGRLELLDVGEDRMIDAGLRDCLLEGLDAVRWASPGPAGTLEVRQKLRMGDYTVPAGPPPLPPESAPPAPGK